MVRHTTEQQTGHLTEPATEVSAETTDLIWGINAIQEALNQGQHLHEILIQKGKAGPRIQEIIDMARSKGFTLRFVDANRMGVPKNCQHQGVNARLAASEFLSLDELLDAGQEGPITPPLLALDCIQDPRNLGSIFRSALAAGFSSIILPKDRSAFVGGTVAQASAGAISRLRLCRVANLAETLSLLKKHNYWIFGAVAEDGVPSLYETDFPPALCLVIGGEGKGIRPLVRKRCDQLITIPMSGNFNSLNASVAAGILMFEINRRRAPLPGPQQE
mgnify:FL=1